VPRILLAFFQMSKNFYCPSFILFISMFPHLTMLKEFDCDDVKCSTGSLLFSSAADHSIAWGKNAKSLEPGARFLKDLAWFRMNNLALQMPSQRFL
jgi:hypothetical protein